MQIDTVIPEKSDICRDRTDRDKSDCHTDRKMWRYHKKWQKHKTDAAKLFELKKLHKNLKKDKERKFHKEQMNKAQNKRLCET